MGKANWSTEQRARIKWACRRGMLELDVLIMPFYEHCFDDLTALQQQAFVDLLSCDDPDLFKWMMRQGQSKQPALVEITEQVLAYNRRQMGRDV